MLRHFLITLTVIVLAFRAEAQDYSLIRPDFTSLASKNHPRLFLSDDDFAALRTLADSTPARKVHDIIMARAGSMVTNPAPIEFRFDESGRRMLEQSRKALDRLLHCSYAYRYSHEKVYLEQVTEDLGTVCSFPSWNAYGHFLDAAEMALGVGIAYDWLYADLEEGLRQKAVEAIRKFAFEPAGDEDAAWFYYAEGNWNQVCNAGLATAAIATCECHQDTVSQRIIKDAIWSNRRAMKTIYSPSGCYAEGPGYWNYGNAFQAVLLSALESGFGEDFGLADIEGFLQTAEYMQLTHRPFGNTFNYSDNHDEDNPAYALWYFADRCAAPSMASNEIRMLEDGRYAESSELRLLPLIIRYVLNIGALTADTIQKDWDVYVNMGSGIGYEDVPVMMIRGNAADCYLGIKGGSPTTNHAHMDGGSFVYDAFGSAWAIDPDTDSYSSMETRCKDEGGDFWDMSQDSERWQMAGLGNAYHNTLTINNKTLNVRGKACITEIIDRDEERGAVLDLGSLYDGELSSAVRRITIDKTGNLTVVDRIVALPDKECVIRWSLVTPAEVTVGRKGLFLRNGGTMVRLRTRAKVTYMEFPSGSDSYRICGFETKVKKGTKDVLETRLMKVR